ncbi:hypothetical protein V6N13_106320 [Hibiscus sabdariffa]
MIGTRDSRFLSFSVFSYPPLSLAQTISEAPHVCSEADRAALLGFKVKIVTDTTESLSSWIGTDCCGEDWEGVQCNPARRVITLALQRPARDSSLYMKGASLHFFSIDLSFNNLSLETVPNWISDR